ncbi:MAG: tryptophan synthase subunit alpha [Planctomycetes bacterium]|nr:tryptophan synthase subunit alpha [Planctomycetota bacterium]
MDALEQIILKVRAAGRKALVPFLVAGYPTAAKFREALMDAAKYADAIEIGIPFSDPLADGPVIQAASAKALAGGVTLEGTFKALSELEVAKMPPLLFMLSINQVLAGGGAKFPARCASAGVAGLIVPDLPHEEAGEMRAACKKAGIALVAMIAPTTSDARAKAILKEAEGFVYLISVAGVTGARGEYSRETVDYLRKIRAMTDKPLCVGFGISGPKHVKQLRQEVDGFIVGSALVRELESGKAVSDMLDRLRSACDSERG